MWEANPTEVPTAIYVHEVSTKSDGFQCHIRVNAGVDADAYVETIQTIVVESPRIESEANGGGSSYVFQQDSAPFHKILQSQD
ncbi:hypothetical protein ACTXT7_007935 [Hymenolepis weldensis]